MFPGSNIAQRFKCAETKAMYLVTFGLAEYFSQKMMENIKDEEFVLLFDESLNEKNQQKQMDLYLRFWANDSISTRYYNSVFMGHATADNLTKELEDSLLKLPSNKIIQLSMDGPNVNWAVFKKLSEQVCDNTGRNLLNVGSCGLHTVHGAIQTGLSKSSWDLDNILTSAYQLFKDSPARREDYRATTGSSSFPLKFVKHRWVENVPVLQRFIEIVPHLKQFILAVNKKKIKNPETRSYAVIVKACQDSLLEVKMHFALSLAVQLEPFLRMYQSDKPLMPFLVKDLLHLIKDICARFFGERCD